MGLNKGKHYKNNVPGNVPGSNALNSNINRDINCTVLDHVSYTALLQQTNKCKFSDAGVPSLKMVIEDMSKIVDYSIFKCYSVRGIVVYGCGSHRDWRDKQDQAVEKGSPKE
eukprot:1832823-Ditylum_brightwellii.AAC.1